MKRTALSLLVWAYFAGQAPAQSLPPAAAPRSADLILHNGRIVTMDDSDINTNPGKIAQAMAVHEGKIAALGSNEQIQAMAGAKTQLVDLKGKTVVPGLIDNHYHLHQAAWNTYMDESPALRKGVVRKGLSGKTPEEFRNVILSVIKKKLLDLRPGQWLVVMAERASRPIGAKAIQQKLLTKAELDTVAPNNPVLIEAKPGNVMNKKAIQWYENTYAEAMAARIIQIDKEIGIAKGITSVRRAAIEFGVLQDAKDAAELIKLAQAAAHRFGFTSLATHVRSRNFLDGYSFLDRKGELTMRVGYAYASGLFLNPNAPAVLKHINDMHGIGSDHLWSVGIEPQTSDNFCTTMQGKRPEVKRSEGCNEPDSKEFQTAKQAAALGMRIAGQHVLGDRQLDLVVRTIVEGSRAAGMSDEEIRQKLHSVDHCGTYPRPDQVEMLKRYNIKINCNLRQSHQMIDDLGENYGAEAQKQFHQWAGAVKHALDAGVKVGMHGPDVEILPYFPHIAAFVTRSWGGRPDHDTDAPKKMTIGRELAIDRVMALKMATIWNAENILKADKIGSLEVGKLADFVVLDRDWFKVPEDQLADTQALMTVVGGKIVHRAKEF